jgi:hypothetical protein
VAEQHRTEGAEDDTPVYQKAAFLDVLHIQCYPFVKAQLVAVRRDLPVAGKAGRGSTFILNTGPSISLSFSVEQQNCTFYYSIMHPSGLQAGCGGFNGYTGKCEKIQGAALYPNRLFVLCI